ncbi:septal ring lytic transglycosylase RlpA family protein [Methylocystis sp. MJC1]|jgi:rare lipoprotein A|uniref:septal ring lytic transglycosylase RlpA family protein n=1 Tax=Methylocystis sp. MJC1 TaxID=2654282 RepID=UPI001FEDD6F6|nr:septal ring lytic transglycosylase RlpA family protein [Methylocystis sp. MJC1]KAF2992094.1 RlpA-like protein [Methylocystis sp. MJC1]UZX10194.1 septal ring lytic transglycosylase RlpA family protein [Methylocystis sp. MJC1]
MKRVSVVVAALGLMSVPAAAQDFLSQLFGGTDAGSQQQQSTETRHYGYGRHARGDENAFGYAMPENARSFVANASYYGGGPRKYEPNSHTANGERFNQWGLTAAHRTLPLGTRLLVSHGGRSVVVRVNDRGPAAWTGRSLDLSRGAASRIGLISSGTGAVHVQVLGRS